VRGAQGGYRLGIPGDQLRLATIVEPFLVPAEHRCIMGRTRCRDDSPCGAHLRWKTVKDTARAFFAELTVADLVTRDPGHETACESRHTSRRTPLLIDAAGSCRGGIMSSHGKTIAGALAGAGLMYLMDPDRGARRRALMRDQAVRARHRLAEGAEATGRDLRNRAAGTAAELRSRFRRETAGDEVLHERVRSALGRVVAHPGAVAVEVADGRVTLQGQVLANELDDLLRTVRGVRGVSEVRNELEVSSSPHGIPSLQGGRPRESRAELAQEHWAPATRMIVAGIGGALALRGLRSEGVVGPALVTIGGLLVARALTNLPATRLTGIGAGRRAVEVQKAIHVAAPVERVWELWSDFESFPRFMAHLKEVRRTGEGRSHWVAAGPGGTGVEWDAVTTQWIPNEVIAWKSIEGSTVENSGRVHFRPDERGGTLVEIRMSYNPPAGAVGHTVASLLGIDLETALDEDMVRLKSLLEEGKATADQGPVRLEELPASQAPQAS
jgi:uncharacterized membrane protein